VFGNLKSKSNRQEFLAFVALAAMLTWFCDEMIFSGKIPFFRDLAPYFYPIKFSVAEAFKAGELPLWERRMAAGFPIMAGFQSAVFYPPSSAYFLLPFFAAVQFTFVFHYAVAASGSYVLFRSWKCPVFVAVIGAILFAFGGTTVSLTNLLNHFQSAVWLPWLVYFWERTVKTERWSALVVFSIVSLCQLLAGSPEIFALSMGLVVLDTIRMYGEGECRSFCRNVGILSAAGLIIIGLGMVQLLPTAELIFQSRRDQPIPASEALAWSLRPSSLIGVLLPTLEADKSLSLGVRLLFAEGLPFLLSHYIGIIAVFGLCSWLVTARMKERIIVVGLLGFSLSCAVGSYTPIYPFLYEWVPILRVIRFPEKFYYLTSALLIFATLRGVRTLVDSGSSHTTWVVAAAIPAGWISAYMVFRWDPNLLVPWIHPLQTGQALPTVNPTTIATILFSLEKQIAISSLLAGILLLNRFKLLRATLVRSLLALVVFVDLSIANKPLHFLRDKELIQNVPRLLEKPPVDHGRIFYYAPGSNLHPSFFLVTGDIPSYEKGLEIALNNLLPNAGMLYGFEYFQDIDALGRRTYTDFLNFINALASDQRGNLLRVLNVKYVVAFHSLDIKGLKLVREFPEHYSKLYEVKDGVPRTYLVSRATYDQDPMSTLRRLSSEAFDPMREVVVDAPTHGSPKPSFQGDATIKLYQNNKVQIDARLSHPGILVLADAFYPGWKVFVDGVEEKILRANYLFRGVELPAGNHRVEFVYDPLSFKFGLVISSLTAALVFAVPLVGWILRRAALRRSGTALSQSSLSQRANL
jgi:Bacterial membrane protein YfhO